ncbi:MAG: D-alanine--D-alanine ligase [Synechococcaceae cyanobacterium SM2_3_1]|nr:D-alanine--D-alanine ligase [Synechococcaceae cyanobacterium SM2_3_1]
MNILLLAGGPSPEREVSLATGKAVKAALEDLGHKVSVLEPGSDLPHQLWQAKQEGCEFVWIALHGSPGEDGTVQAFLDWLALPYQGSGLLASAVAMDKVAAKHLFRSHQIPTPAWVEHPFGYPWTDLLEVLGSPLIIKPVASGSSVGVHVLHQASDLQSLAKSSQVTSETWVAEQFIAGKEITISILDGVILPAVEIIPILESFYSYAAKYGVNGSRHLTPTSLTEAGLCRTNAVALAAYRALKCEGLARVDLRVDAQEDPWVLEVNTLPGMTPTSLAPDAAAALGWSFPDLVQKLLESGLARFQHGQPSHLRV